MSAVTVISLIISAGLFVYLGYALIRGENL
ncbi:MAG: K(+)-transporting ATPase subunit F [Solirubrobacterales bacterium]|nr:K(+)-transporting ATPase subunit F [Solirubrobacterales bacterium]